MKILIYGYGNPGRKDDGLGIALTEMIKNWIINRHISNVEVDMNYQLNIEDAEKISKYDKVVFVDASQENDLTNFILEDVKPKKDKIEFTMHAVSPGYIAYLSQNLFNTNPDVKVLKIKGYCWKMEEGISDSAMLNMERAFQFLTCKLERWLKMEISENLSHC